MSKEPPQVTYSRRVDAGLSAVAESFDYLLAVTPVNAGEELEAFRARGHRGAPRFAYAPGRTDAAGARAQLEGLPVDAVADDGLRALFEAKRREIGLWLELAETLGTPRFLEVSLALYGGVDDELLADAEFVLAGLPREARGQEPGGELDGAAFARLCQDEIARYRRDHPALDSAVRLDPVFPGVMVSGRDVIVGADYRLAAARAEALVQHEVGTHVVTNCNGAAQPLRLMASGLPGYEETQEGLAVFAEYLVGGLTVPRLALLAARVLATRRLLEGAAFADVYAELVDAVGLREDRAWEVAMRTWRGGGLTKDVIYLRGLARVVRHVAGGGALEPLALGKFDLADLPLVERLRAQGTLREPLLTPRWLAHPAAPALLEAAREGTLASLLDGLWGASPAG